MRKRIAAVGLGIVLGANGASAQPLPNSFPPGPAPAALPQIPTFPTQPTFPAQPGQPGLLPALAPRPGLVGPVGTPNAPPPGYPTQPKPASPAAMQSAVPLPQPEQKFAISAMDVSVKRVVGGWEVWAGQKVMRNTGDNEANARDLAHVLRDLRPTEWVTIGGTKPVVEYGLTNGRPAVTGSPPVDAQNNGNRNGTVAQAGGIGAHLAAGTSAKYVQPIDLRTARVEAVRGVWVVRDDNNILLNFGTDKSGAEQASAVIQRYGFNRIGVVGPPTQPTMNYLFVSLEQTNAAPGGLLMMQAQIDALTRTGIPVPGVGFTGEMIKIDPRKVEARKDGFEWVVAFGPEVLGRFGPTEWTAREAARAIQEAKFTEFCKLGGASGLTFFLTNGKAPTRAPYNAQGRSFDKSALRVQQINQKWAVTDAGKQLFEVGSAQEGEIIVRVLKAYGFDQTAHLSAGGSKGGIRFFIKNGR
ncbi:MAG TPA: hypothetical protein VGE74_32470 [Gemmata sp.]